MLIAEFSKVCGLPVETVRFYIKKGLLTPTRGENAYQRFCAADVTVARMIRLQQSLGYSLREIAVLQAQYRAGERSTARTCEVLESQIARLEEKRALIDDALSFLHAKVDWIKSGESEPPPLLGDVHC